MKKVGDVKTEADLLSIIKEISDFNHDYGTIVIGCFAAMKAAFKVVNNSPQGGITGFQAGCLGWECIKEFFGINGPARLLEMENLLYPQYDYKFDKTVSTEVWTSIQEKARKNISDNSKGASEKVVARWKSIADGQLPNGFVIKD